MLSESKNEHWFQEFYIFYISLFMKEAAEPT